MNVFTRSSMPVRVAITVAVVTLFRLGAHVPSPFLPEGFTTSGEGAASLLQLKGGQRLSLFGLGVMPFVTASLLVSLVSRSVPYLQGLRGRGPDGVMRLRSLIRWAAVGLSVPVALANLRGRDGSVDVPLGLTGLVSHVLFQVTGLLVLLALAEIVTRHGVGNGVSLLLVATVLSGAAPAVSTVSGWPALLVSAFAGCTLLSAAAIVTANRWVRERPVFSIHPHTEGRPVTSQTTRVTAGGAGPMIFATAVLATAGSLVSLLPLPAAASAAARSVVNGGGTASMLLLAILTAMFARVYVNVAINPVEGANAMTRSGRFLYGTLPGVDTARRLAVTANAAGWLYAAVLFPVAAWPALLVQLGGQQIPADVAGVAGVAVVIPVLVLADLLAGFRRPVRV